ncbi:MAG: hypothetical protein VR70_02515 [Rhodospirillaceae bacterium BRH_c57]|nr:MAG: hypothetical protein VR70_02515 [Rhodospirillaceae bacterium BRH_c57]
MTAAARFLQIHTLTSYPAVLLNRDDAGYAKRIEFGGAVRTRVSSQCLKRHWRTADDEWALSNVGVDMAIRSRETFDRCVVRPLVEGEGLDQDAVLAATEVFIGHLFQESAKAKKKKGETKPENFHTSQVVVLGKPEVDYVRDQVAAAVQAGGSAEGAAKAAEDALKGLKDNIAALRVGAGLDAAMFGRMITSDILARKNAAVHVAHAFTVHGEEAESDYFTAVDDLLTGKEETGSGHLGQTELTSGLYYGYVVVDMPTLVANIEGCDPRDWLTADRATAAKVVEHLAHLIATISPGAKLGSTAPYSYAELVLLETGSRQPRTLANAFRKPVKARGEDVLDAAARALSDHMATLDETYGCGETRWAAGAAGAGLPGVTGLSFNQAVAEAVAGLGR